MAAICLTFCPTARRTTGRWNMSRRTLIGPAAFVAMLDGEGGSVEIAELPQSQVEFDRFGIITTWIDGNAQRVYFDDLTYTTNNSKPAEA